MLKKDLYILGNGFDLFWGFKTKYSDFMENKKYNEIRKELECKLNFHKGVIKGSGNSIEKMRKKEEEKKLIKKYGKNNLFLLYLIMHKDSGGNHWYEIENKISNYASSLKISENFVIREEEVKKFFDLVKKEKGIDEKNIDKKLFEELENFEKKFWRIYKS